jgi:hypothetical protein
VPRRLKAMTIRSRFYSTSFFFLLVGAGCIFIRRIGVYLLIVNVIIAVAMFVLGFIKGEGWRIKVVTEAVR